MQCRAQHRRAHLPALRPAPQHTGTCHQHGAHRSNIVCLRPVVAPARVPSWRPQYLAKERVTLWVNKVGPYNNPQETYNYFYLPFCRSKPGEKAEHSWGGLGEVLQGNELINSQLDIKFKGEGLPTSRGRGSAASRLLGEQSARCPDAWHARQCARSRRPDCDVPTRRAAATRAVNTEGRQTICSQTLTSIKAQVCARHVLRGEPHAAGGASSSRRARPASAQLSCSASHLSWARASTLPWGH